MPHSPSALTHQLRQEIRAKGPISFARFMEVALYDPAHGYYQQGSKQIGCQGDFYTSVSVGSLFGELLAVRFGEWLCASHPGAPGDSGGMQLVEIGAHDGRLALDILSWFQKERPDILSRIDYWIVEPLAHRRNEQAQTLHPFAHSIRWFSDWTELQPGSIRGVVFSNELLDSFPVMRLGWDAQHRTWFEWQVGDSADGFVWVRGEPAARQRIDGLLESGLGRPLPAELLAVLPDGFTLDLCPQASAWWAQAAGRLAEGRLMTLDYGLEWHEFLAPHRVHGTLRSYRRHHFTADPLADVGNQDLTAHVNFSALIQAGENAGLKTEVLCSQAEFLSGIATGLLATWDPARNRQFHALTHPEQLGASFRVLVQSRTA